jgi:transcriptional regulator with XRE-family HTH domain
MGTSNSCIHAEVQVKRLPKFEAKEVGIPIILIDSVVGEVCTSCEAVISHTIEYPDRLIAAAAVCRVMQPQKLMGSEIRFLRKTANQSGKKLADLLEVSPETVSRWENDKLPISPQSEKLLRLYIGHNLAEKAPAIDFFPTEILDMDIRPSLKTNEPLVIELELVPLKTQGQRGLERYFTQTKAA